MKNQLRTVNDEDRKRTMNVRRSVIYNMMVKDNNLKTLKLGNINFESEATEGNEEIQVLSREDSLMLVAQEAMGLLIETPEQRKVLDKTHDRMLETIRMSYQVQVQNLATKFKTLLREILERRLLELRHKFEQESKQIMNQFFDLKASLHLKENRLKSLQIQICELEGKHTQQKQSAESQLAVLQKRVAILPRGENSLKEQYQNLQIQHETLADEYDSLKADYDKIKWQLEAERIETTRLKVIEQQKYDADQRLNEQSKKLREAENRFTKLQNNIKLTAPKKQKDFDAKMLRSSSKTEIDGEDISKTKKDMTKLLGEYMRKSQLSVAQCNKLREEIKFLKDMLIALERKLLEQEQKTLNQPQNPTSILKEKLDDLLLSSFISQARPSTSVNHYYEAPNFTVYNPLKYSPRSLPFVNENDFKLERLSSVRARPSPDQKKNYSFDSQGYVTKAEKIFPSPRGETQVFLEVKRLKANPLEFYTENIREKRPKSLARANRPKLISLRKEV